MGSSAFFGFLFLLSLSIFFLYFYWYAKSYLSFTFTSGRGKEKKSHEYNHGELGLLIVAAIFYMLLYVPGLYTESTQQCEFILQNTTVQGNTTHYSTAFTCSTPSQTHTEAFWQITQLMLIVVIVYFIFSFLVKITLFIVGLFK